MIGVHLTFHATTDQQAARDRVFELLGQHEFRIDATIFEEPKTQPRLQSEDALYELAWYLHMQYVAPRIVTKHDELMVVGASISTNKRRQALKRAVDGVVQQTVKRSVARTAYWPAATGPCLQIADYCCWAIQRKWEQGEPRSHVLIQHKIRSEYEIFRLGKTLYY